MLLGVIAKKTNEKKKQKKMDYEFRAKFSTLFFELKLAPSRHFHFYTVYLVHKFLLALCIGLFEIKGLQIWGAVGVQFVVS